MQPRLTLLLGMLLLAAPAVPTALLTRSDPVPRAWPKSPPEPPPPATAPARWDGPARDSLALLRRTTVREARRALSALRACEAHAARAAPARRNQAYRRCATEPLARASAFAAANSRMLAGLAALAHPARACRGRLLRLAGATSNLAFLAAIMLRAGLATPWRHLLNTSHSVRGLATDALRLARGPDWRRICRPRPPAKQPAAAVA